MNMELSNVPYYHGSIERQEAVGVLTGKPDGSFLLRKRVGSTDSYAISLTYEGTVLHYRIERSTKTSMYSIELGSAYDTPIKLCEHYMEDKGGLRSQLLHPVICGTYAPPPVNDETLSRRLSLADNYEQQDWFHGDISREEDAYRLSCAYRQKRQDGIYLVRQKDPELFVLSLVFSARVHRYKIKHEQDGPKYYILGKRVTFPSLEGLLDHYRNDVPDGLLCPLARSCSKKTSKSLPNLPGKKNNRKTSGGIMKTVRNMASALASELKLIMPANSLDVNWSETPDENLLSGSTYSGENDLLSHSVLSRFNRKSMPRDTIGFQSPYRNLSTESEHVVPDLYITPDKLTLKGDLGRGHFGSVMLGECNINGSMVPCAVKNLTGSDIEANKSELLNEAAIMQKLDHPYIVRLLAICDPDRQSDNLMIVLELAPLGSLRDFLKHHDEISFQEDRLLVIMQQVCDGMAYLSSQSIVHRDLAARNILLVTENFAKISDFGMSRILHDSENYYKAAKPGAWPLRWYAPESLTYYKFSPKSDVWSFGVTLWEVFSYGSRPYQNMKGRDILTMLESGMRLECPCGCSPGVYSMMLQCWAFSPEERPSFSELLGHFQSFTDAKI